MIQSLKRNEGGMMADTLTQEERSKRMALIHSKNTIIEIKVRKYLFSKGFRFRVNDKRYAGHPDIVLPKYKTMIFIHGCFWHGHHNCKIAHIPKSNSEFWIAKINRNMKNDAKHNEVLKSQGWNVITLWECELNRDFEKVMTTLTETLQNHFK